MLPGTQIEANRMVSNTFHRLWQSAIVMSWGGIAVRLLGFFVVLPVVLATFPTEVVSVWLLLMTLSGLQLLADMGFAPTFSRIMAYAMGGADGASLRGYRSLAIAQRQDGPNWHTMALIVATMRPVYRRLALTFLALLLVFGTWSLRRPIALMPQPALGWWAWSVVLATSSYALYSSFYAAYLLGTNHVAVLRRWEMLTSLATTVVSLLVLIVSGDLLSFVIVGQLGIWVQISRYRRLCHQLEDGRFKTFKVSQFSSEVFDSVWPSAWRSGFAVLMGFGLLQASGIIYAQIGSPSDTAAYLLALRMIQTISSFSQAPFYTKLPYLAQLRAQGDYQEQVRVAGRGMTWSYWTYVAGFVAVGLGADFALRVMGSNTNFVEPRLWALIGVAILVERYGAMHLNLYSTTNHIISHVANGVAGVLFVAVSALLASRAGVFAFPLGLLAGNLGFYAWYSARHSYRAFHLRFWSFERAIALPPLAVVLLYVGWAVL